MSSIIPREILDEIIGRIDLVSAISQVVTLKKSGQNYKGLCPFHQEKTPSFMVSPQKNIFHCFGCGEGGNIFSFFMKLNNLTFPEVVHELAIKAGIDLSKYRRGGEADNREILFKINRYAAWYYSENLKSPMGQKAYNYLNKRGLTDQTALLFQLGYAPDSWDGLVQFLKKKEVPLNYAETLGLVRKRKDGSYYDFFRDRLMFPIIDFDSRVQGFGGRILNDEQTEAKYINSSESPVYHKGSSIYGLKQAKEAIRETKQVILVEGYLDLIRLYQEGIQNCVAPLGTALTISQATLLARFSQQFILMFDGDEAGRAAVWRALPILLEAGFHPKLVRLPSHEDPDSFIGNKGVEALKRMIQKSRLAMECLMVEVFENAGKETTYRVQAVEKLLPFITSLPSELEKKSYQSKIAQFLGVKEENLFHLTNKNKGRSEKSTRGKEQTKNSLERILLQLYVTYPKIVNEIATNGLFEYFEDDRLKEIGLKLSREYSEHGRVDLDKLIGPESELDTNFVSKLVFDCRPQTDGDSYQMVKDCYCQWKKQRLKSVLCDLTSKIHLAELKKDEDSLKELLVRKNETQKSLKNLDGYL